MNYEEMIKAIYQLRDETLKDNTGLRDYRLRIDILNQINYYLFPMTTVPDYIGIKYNPVFSPIMFETSAASILKSLGWSYTFWRKEMIGSSTIYIYRTKKQPS